MNDGVTASLGTVPKGAYMYGVLTSLTTMAEKTGGGLGGACEPEV